MNKIINLLWAYTTKHLVWANNSHHWSSTWMCRIINIEVKQYMNEQNKRINILWAQTMINVIWADGHCWSSFKAIRKKNPPGEGDRRVVTVCQSGGPGCHHTSGNEISSKLQFKV